MEFFFAVLLLVLFVRWLIMSRRMREMERRIEEAGANQSTAADIAALVRRIYHLEAEVERLRGPSRVATAAPAVTVEKPVEQPSVAPPMPSLCSLCGHVLPP